MVKIIIVNDNDEIIGLKERGTLDKNDIYRVSALWIENSNGKILLAKRALTKKHHPGRWGPAVAGTNDVGESYKSNIIKKASEEIGLNNCEFKLGKKKRVSEDYNYFCQWYFLIVDKELDDFTIQKDEVEEIKWFDKDEFLRELKNNPKKFVDGFKDFDLDIKSQ